MIQKAGILMQAPNSLRIEIAPPIGLPNLFLSVKDGTIMLYVPPQKTLYVGRATPANLAQFLALGIPVEQLAASLIGKTAQLGKGEELRDGFADGEYLRLNIFWANGKSRSHWIHTDGGYLSRSEIFAEGEIRYSIELKDYRLIDKRAIPHLIEIIQFRPEEARLRIEYLDAILDEGGDASDFRLDVPAGAKVVYLD